MKNMTRKIFLNGSTFLLGLLLVFFIQTLGSFTYSYQSDLKKSDVISDLRVQKIIYSPPIGKDIITDGKNKSFRGKNLYSLNLFEKIVYYRESFTNIVYLAIFLYIIFGISLIFIMNRMSFIKVKLPTTIYKDNA